MPRVPAWPLYKRLGLPQLLTSAAQIVSERGLAKGTTIHSGSGRVDALGALALAAGVPEESLGGDIREMADAAPAYRAVLLLVAWETMESWIDSDLGVWSDAGGRSASQVARAFTGLAGLIAADSQHLT